MFAVLSWWKNQFSMGIMAVIAVMLPPKIVPDSKVHGANMGPIWGRQGPGGPHVGPMNLAIWGSLV